MARRKKKKIKPFIPPNRGASDKAYGEFVAALENLYSLFRTLSEAQDLHREEMGRGFAHLGEAIHNLDRRVIALEERIDTIDTRLTAMETKVGTIADDVTAMKHEVRLIRHDLTQKVNREEFEILEERVARLEKELQVR